MNVCTVRMSVQYSNVLMGKESPQRTVLRMIQRLRLMAEAVLLGMVEIGGCDSAHLGKEEEVSPQPQGQSRWEPFGPLHICVRQLMSAIADRSLKCPWSNGLEDPHGSVHGAMELKILTVASMKRWS